MSINQKIIAGYLLLVAVANGVVVYMLYEDSPFRSLLWAAGSILMLSILRTLVEYEILYQRSEGEK